MTQYVNIGNSNRHIDVFAKIRKLFVMASGWDGRQKLTAQLLEQEAHQLVGRHNAAPLEFDPKLSEASFSTAFSLALPTGSS